MTREQGLFPTPPTILPAPARPELTAPVDRYLAVGRSAIAQTGAMADALRAVLTLHYPIGWYEECGTDCTTPEDEHFYVGPDAELWTCERSQVGTKCAECTPEYPDDNSVDWPCATAKAVTERLL